MVQAPLRAVREDARIPLRERSGAGANVAGELRLGLLAYACAAQVAFDLDGGEAGLDVDAPAAADLDLELGLDEVLFTEVEAAVEQQGADIGLDIGFGSGRAAGEQADECGEVKRG